MTTKDAVLLNMARNAILVAGHEMGRDGDHWPAIKSAVHGLTHAYEAMKLEEEVAAKLKAHMKKAIDDYTSLVAQHRDGLDAAQQKELDKFIADLRDLYAQRFEDASQDNVMGDWMKMASGMEGLMPWKRAAAIISTLDEEI